MAAKVTGETASTTGANRRSHRISCCSVLRLIHPGLKYCLMVIREHGARLTRCATWCARISTRFSCGNVSGQFSMRRGGREFKILLSRFFYTLGIASDFRTIRRELKKYPTLNARRGPAPGIAMINPCGLLLRCYRWASRRALSFRAMASNGITFLLNISIGHPGNGLPSIQRLTGTLA